MDYELIMNTFNSVKVNLWNFLTFIPKWTAATPADIELVYVDDVGIETRKMIPNVSKLMESQSDVAIPGGFHLATGGLFSERYVKYKISTDPIVNLTHNMIVTNRIKMECDNGEKFRLNLNGKSIDIDENSTTSVDLDVLYLLVEKESGMGDYLKIETCVEVKKGKYFIVKGLNIDGTENDVENDIRWNKSLS